MDFQTKLKRKLKLFVNFYKKLNLNFKLCGIVSSPPFF